MSLRERNYNLMVAPESPLPRSRSCSPPLLRLLPPQVLLPHSPAPVVCLEESGISRDASRSLSKPSATLTAAGS